MVKACAVFACPEPVAYRGRCQRHGGQVDQLRSLGSDRHLGKKLYATARWKALRRYLLTRTPVCPCAECTRLGRVRLTSVVHHLQPHGGDVVKFFDERHLQPLAKPCHDRLTATGVGTRFPQRVSGPKDRVPGTRPKL